MDRDIIAAIFEQAAVGIAQVDTKTGDFIQLNQKYCDIVGYQKAELEKITFMEITHPEDLGKDLHYMRELKEGVINDFQMEKRYYHKDGHIVWVKLTVSLLGDYLRRPMYHIAVVEDITDKKVAEIKLQNTLEELKMLKGIISVCSYCHHIRNDEGNWDRMEAYFAQYTDAKFSHGICPKCLVKVRESVGLEKKSLTKSPQR